MDGPRNPALRNLRLARLTDCRDNVREGGHDGGMIMPQYFFDVRSSEWNYRDPDGITLDDDNAAIAYAERMISELKADEGYEAPDLQMFVKVSQRRIVAIPFNPTKVRTLRKSRALMGIAPRLSWH
jgi:hypothetical protein